MARKNDPKSNADALLSIDELKHYRASLEKELGYSFDWGSAEGLEVRFLPLGIPSFDRALGGGIPFGRLILVYGEFSAGKTTFVHLIIKAAQARGLSCLYIDAERAWNPEWAAALGVDIDNLLIARPTTGERAYDTAIAAVRRRVGLVVIDSLSALTPSVELEAGEEELLERQTIGGQARLNNRGLRMLVNENRSSIVIAINQLRETAGVSFGNPEVIPGGKGQRYYPSQMIRVRRGSWIEEGKGEDKRRIGYKMRIRVEKNKVGRPFEEAEVPFYFTGEIDELAGLVELCLELDIIHADPPHYYLGWSATDGSFTEKIYGRRALLDAVRARPDLQEALRAATATVEEIDL